MIVLIGTHFCCVMDMKLFIPICMHLKAQLYPQVKFLQQKMVTNCHRIVSCLGALNSVVTF
jgi:hypothetical protein